MEAEPARTFRPAMFLCDEYHVFATVGESDPTGDEKFFALSRQAKCIPIVATPSGGIPEFAGDAADTTDRHIVRFGLTRAQWRALKALHRRPGMRQNELAEQLDMEPIAVGRVIDRLQAAGFVERRADPKDRRAWRLHDTEQARGVIDGMEDIARGLRRDSTAGISPDDLNMMLAVLDRMKENLQSLDGPSEES